MRGVNDLRRSWVHPSAPWVRGRRRPGGSDDALERSGAVTVNLVRARHRVRPRGGRRGGHRLSSTPVAVTVTGPAESCSPGRRGGSVTPTNLDLSGVVERLDSSSSRL